MATLQFLFWTVASGAWASRVLLRTGDLVLSVAAGVVFFATCSLVHRYLP